MRVAFVSDCTLYFFQEIIQWFRADFVNLNLVYGPPNNNLDLNPYDLAIVYLIDLKKVPYLKVWKQEFPKTKIVLITDSDFWWITCPWIQNTNMTFDQETLDGLRAADFVYCLNPETKKVYDTSGVRSILDFPMSRVPSYIPVIKSFKERKQENKAVIIAHSQPQYTPRTNFVLAQKLGLKPVVIGTFHNKDLIRHWCGGSQEAEYYERFQNAVSYMEKLNECLLGLEDWYAGGSRFVIECAVLGVPVVGSENIVSLQILSPEFTCHNGQEECLIEKGKSLINNEQLYNEVSKRIREKAISYFSPEETRKRFVRNIEERLNIALELT